MERLIKELKEKYYVDGKFTAPEYITTNGLLDHKYLQKVTGTKISIANFKKLVIDTFGTLKFELADIDNEVSFEEFAREYEFGKYVDTKRWIGYWRTLKDKNLSTKALFSYLMRLK